MRQHGPDDPALSMPERPVNAGDAGRPLNRVRYIEHAGKRILLADISGCTPEELLECIEAVPRHVTKEPEHSVLLLGDLTGAQFTKEAIEHLKIATVFNRSHVAKAAWVLSDDFPKVLMESIRAFSARDIPVFSTREEALDYLLRD
jgi:hypothetical protein